MNRRTMAVLTCFALAIAVSSGLHAVGPESAPTELAPFEGKLAIVAYLNEGKPASILVEKIQIRKLGTRSFMVGTGVDEWSDPNWSNGIVVWLPVDGITHIYEVNDKEHAAKLYNLRDG